MDEFLNEHIKKVIKSLTEENEKLKKEIVGLNIQIGELKSELTTVRCQNR